MLEPVRLGEPTGVQFPERGRSLSPPFSREYGGACGSGPAPLVAVDGAKPAVELGPVPLESCSQQLGGRGVLSLADLGDGLAHRQRHQRTRRGTVSRVPEEPATHRRQHKPRRWGLRTLGFLAIALVSLLAPSLGAEEYTVLTDLGLLVGLVGAAYSSYRGVKEATWLPR
jgi:hypothetical protein